MSSRSKGKASRYTLRMKGKAAEGRGSRTVCLGSKGRPLKLSLAKWGAVDHLSNVTSCTGYPGR